MIRNSQLVAAPTASMLHSTRPLPMLCLAEQCLDLAGLQNDCPFRPEGNGQSQLSADDAEQVPTADFEEYASRLNSYLQVLSCCRTRRLLHERLVSVCSNIQLAQSAGGLCSSGRLLKLAGNQELPGPIPCMQTGFARQQAGQHAVSQGAASGTARWLLELSLTSGQQHLESISFCSMACHAKSHSLHAQAVADVAASDQAGPHL